MITKALEENFLRYMYKRQVQSCGYGIRNLEGGKLFITHGPGIEEAIPGICVVQNGTKKYLVVEVSKELFVKGLVQFSADNTCFWLTPAGYNAAAKTRIQKLLDYLNKNPGLSIPIAVASFIISIITPFINPGCTQKFAPNTAVEQTANGASHVPR